MRTLCALFLLSLGCAHHAPPAAKDSAPHAVRPPRLIVQITVDQLRTDLVSKYADRYGPSGFARFLEQGTFYENAHYAHAITETAAGHATLFTGALPRDHGIVGNEWFDRREKKTRYAVEDARYHWLGRDAKEGAGTSPSALRVSTLGDELRLASQGRALVFALSVKDRAAILPAGHAGKAFWYDDTHGDFVTSDYYYTEEPAWLLGFRATRPMERYVQEPWNLLLPRDTYVLHNADDRPFEKSYKHLGRTFPHPLVGATPQDSSKGLKRTPFGDALTVDAVAALLAAEPLGKDGITDLLAVSLSSTDYVGHAFGPESLEAEDNLLRLDRTLARLFELLLAVVPQDELLVALSSDHGVCESPEALEALSIPAGRHDQEALVRDVNAELERRFGPSAAFVLAFVNPALWLDESAIAARSLALADVEQAVADIVLARPGFAHAVTKSSLATAAISSDPLQARVLASFDRERSGNVYLVPSAGWLLSSDAADMTAMHGTPWAYDTAVPVAFWGAAVSAQRISRAIDPRAIAPTLASRAHVKPPSGSTGETLREIVAF